MSNEIKGLVNITTGAGVADADVRYPVLTAGKIAESVLPLVGYSSGEFELVERKVFTAPASNHSLTSLDGDAVMQYLVRCVIKNNYDGANDFNCRINADTGSNYQWLSIRGNGSAVISQNNAGDSGITAGYSAVLNGVTTSTIIVETKSGINRPVHSESVWSSSTSEVSYLERKEGFWLNSADPISEIGVFSTEVDGIGAGSYIELWRKKEVNLLPSIINTDINLYVATTGSDTTGDGSAGAPWATLDKALTYLNDYRINDNGSVTINVLEGEYALSSAQTINHLDGSKISIVGVDATGFNVTGIVSKSGTAGDWEIILQLDTVTGITAGQYVRVGTMPYTDTDFPVWVANTAYSVGDWIRPTSANDYGHVMECTTAGTSHATTEPTWGTDDTTVPVDSTIADNGTLVWTKRVQPSFAEGGFEVLNVNSGDNRITIQSYHRMDYQPQGDLSNYTIPLTVVKTIFSLSSASEYFRVYDLGSMDKVVIRHTDTDANGEGILSLGEATFGQSVIITNCTNIGLYVSVGTCTFYGCLTNCKHGIYGDSEIICFAYYCKINGSLNYGVRAINGARIITGNYLLITGCTYAVYVALNGDVRAVKTRIYGCTYGLYAYSNSSISLAYESYMKHIIGYSSRLISRSFCIVAQSSGYEVGIDHRGGGPTPAIDTLSADQCWNTDVYYT